MVKSSIAIQKIRKVYYHQIPKHAEEEKVEPILVDDPEPKELKSIIQQKPVFERLTNALSKTKIKSGKTVNFDV